MAYVYTGTKRSLTFTLTKKVGGVVQLGYPKTYNGLISWGNSLYPTINTTQFAQLTTSQYNARLAAFLAHVESIEAGYDSSTDMTNASTAVDVATCPPPPTTTTTTAAPTTTTTTAAATTTTTTAAATTTTTP